MMAEIEDFKARDKMNYSLTNRFSNYLRDTDIKNQEAVLEGEASLAEAHLQSKISTKKTIQTHLNNLAYRKRLKLPDDYTNLMESKRLNSRKGTSQDYHVKETFSVTMKSEKMKSTSKSFKIEDRDERRVTEKVTSQLNDERIEEANYYAKVLNRKLKDKRIIVRDKKVNQNKIFRDMLEDIATKHFAGERKSFRSRSIELRKNQTTAILIDRKDYKKIEDNVKVELGLNRLKDQLLDDFTYLSNKERNEGPNLSTTNATTIGKQISRMLINEAEIGASKKKEVQTEAAKKLAEINEFMMEKAALNFRGVGRDPTNEGLSYNLELCRVVPDNYSNGIARRWFQKGVETCRQMDLLASINSFKQAVIHDSELFPAIYNLGCLYENVKDFELAFKWFYLAKTIEPEDRDVNFALALCYFKLKRYNSAIELLNKHCLNEEPESVASKSSSVLNISTRAVQTYILSICYKGSLDSEKAEETYNKFLSMIDDSSNRDIAMYLFALLNKKNAGFSQRKLEEVKMGLLKSFKSTFPDEVESIYRYWDLSKKTWAASTFDVLVETLSKMHFFKRFPKRIMVR